MATDISLIRIHELQTANDAVDLPSTEIAIDRVGFSRAYKIPLIKVFTYIKDKVVTPALDTLHLIAHTGNYGDLNAASIPQHLRDQQDANQVLASDNSGHVAYTDPMELLKIRTIDLDD